MICRLATNNKNNNNNKNNTAVFKALMENTKSTLLINNQPIENTYSKNLDFDFDFNLSKVMHRVKLL